MITVIVLGGLAAAALALLWVRRRRRDAPDLDAALAVRPEAPDDHARFDALLARFAAAGLPLADGRTKDELLASYNVQDYVDAPGLLLFMMGAEVEEEPWGRWFSDKVYALDFECVHDEDAYAEVFHDLARIAGVTDQIEALDSHVDFDAETIALSYRIGPIQRSIKTDDWQNDWLHADIFEQMLADLTQVMPARMHFWSVENGQGEILAALTPQEAAAVGDLIQPEQLRPIG